MPTLKGLAMTPKTWSRSILSTLNPVKHNRKKDRKAPRSTLPDDKALPVPTQRNHSLNVPSSPHSRPQTSFNPSLSAASTGKTPDQNTSTVALIRIESANSNSTSTEGLDGTMAPIESEGIPSITLTGIDSPRVLLSGIPSDREVEVSDESRSNNHLRPPLPTLRRRRGTRRFSPLNATTNGNVSENPPNPHQSHHNSRNEVLPLTPGLPTVLFIDGGDCLVSILRALPDYRRNNAQPTDVAVVETCGKTTHRVVFMGQNAFLVHILDRLPVPLLSTTVSVPGVRHMEPELNDDTPDASGTSLGKCTSTPLDSGAVIEQVLVQTSRIMEEQTNPEAHKSLLVDLHVFQPERTMNESHQSTTMFTMGSQGRPDIISRNDDLEDKHTRHHVSHTNAVGPGINTIPFPSIISSSPDINDRHVQDRSHMQEPISPTPAYAILVNYADDEESIESIDPIYYPEPGQVQQPPIGSGRPSAFQGLTLAYRTNAVSLPPNPRRREARTQGFDGSIIESHYEAVDGYTPRLPTGLWNLE